ncbi:MAG: MbcA/ParS/Xre antitoxin family protein [Gammaproteobacteria bacterium]|nr:MbcA/ParS/Xre antitoxin family protein [Gammaproteobacteria bacterium]
MLGFSLEKQILMTQKVMQSLEEWGLSASEQLDVLNLPEGTRSRKLRAFHEETPFPDHPDVEYRVVRLLGIIDALRTSHPKNPSMGGRWMKTPHRRFKNKTPVQIMLEEGGSGLTAVLAELDCTYAWDLSGSTIGS